MGPGKADLLDAIEREGSISAAGRSMGMSYRRTWLLVDTMNRCWQGPLVESAAGGSHGGGAKVTDLGRDVLMHYRVLQNRVSNTTKCDDWLGLEAALLAQPRIRQKA